MNDLPNKFKFLKKENIISKKQMYFLQHISLRKKSSFIFCIKEIFKSPIIISHD